MQRRYNLAHFILASVIVLVLTPLMVVGKAQGRIAFMSDRDWHWEIYVMDANGGNPQRLTNNPHPDVSPAWFNSPFSVSLTGKMLIMWGWFKQSD